jgi:hypothetical protein
VLQQTTYWPDGSIHVLGSSVAGLTNQQTWDTYGIAFAGEVSNHQRRWESGCRTSSRCAMNTIHASFREQFGDYPCTVIRAPNGVLGRDQNAIACFKSRADAEFFLPAGGLIEMLSFENWLEELNTAYSPHMQYLSVLEPGRRTRVAIEQVLNAFGIWPDDNKIWGQPLARCYGDMTCYRKDEHPAFRMFVYEKPKPPFPLELRLKAVGPGQGC